jgi:HEAT repeat protein
LDDQDPYVAFGAVIALSEIGPDAKDAIPALLRNFRRKDLFGGSGASTALAKIGAPAVPSLLELLEDKNEDIRSQAILVLGGIGPQAKAATPALKELLAADSTKLQLAAAEALWEIAKEPKSLFVLQAALEDRDRFVRQSAAARLGKIGPDAKTAVPGLSRLLNDDWEGARNDAARALGRIGPDAKESVGALIESAKRARQYLFRTDVVESLRRIGPNGVPVLMDTLKKEDDYAQELAAETLGLIGPKAEAAASLLESMLKNADGRLCTALALALWRIKKHDSAVPALIKCLSHADDAVRWNAAEALGEIGPSAEEAVPALTKSLKDGGDSLRCDAAKALGKIGQKAGSSAEALKTALKDSDIFVRPGAAIALWQISRDPAAIDALVEALHSKRDLERRMAAEALSEFGPDAKAAIPALLKALRDKDSSVSDHAIVALGNIGPDAKEAVPHLVEALKSTAMFTSDWAAAALKKIDPKTANKAGVR